LKHIVKAVHSHYPTCLHRDLHQSLPAQHQLLSSMHSMAASQASLRRRSRAGDGGHRKRKKKQLPFSAL
jgi:hypothetical protein